MNPPIHGLDFIRSGRFCKDIIINDAIIRTNIPSSMDIIILAIILITRLLNRFIFLLPFHKLLNYCAQRLRLGAVINCLLLSFPRTPKFERGRMLELPLKPLWHKHFVELNHPSQIAISKLPDSFDNSKLCTTKISDDEKGIGFYYH